MCFSKQVGKQFINHSFLSINISCNQDKVNVTLFCFCYGYKAMFLSAIVSLWNKGAYFNYVTQKSIILDSPPPMKQRVKNLKNYVTF